MKTLCIGFQYMNNYEELKLQIETCNNFKSLNQFDKTYSGDIGDRLNLFFKRILQQPFVFSETPETFSDFVELSKDRFERSIKSINWQLTEMARNDKEGANVLFDTLLYNTENVLLLMPYLHTLYCCRYKETPLFITLMEFIQSVKKRVTQPATYYPEIENYFAEMEKYKERFISIPEPKKHVKAFNEYFVPSYADTLPQALKLTFAKDNKTTMAVLIHVLRFECEPRILIVEKGDFKDFHETMTSYFSGQDIGARQHHEKTSKDLEGNKTQKSKIDSVKSRINVILQSIDNK